VPEFAGKFGRWNRQDRALRVGQAVGAHLRKGDPGQRAPAASAHDQHIVGAAGKIHQDPAGRATLHVRLHQRIGGNLAPHCDQRVPQPPTGELVPFSAQIARRRDPLGAVTTRRLPGNNRDQDRIVGAGQALPRSAAPASCPAIRSPRRSAGPHQAPVRPLPYPLLGMGIPAASTRPACSARVTATRRACGDGREPGLGLSMNRP
jgi:hypothetical protein